MRIIAFGDIHMSLGGFQDIPGIKNADYIVLTGDLTNFGTKKDAKEILDQVMSINPNVLAQFGNLDSHEINDYLQGLDLNLHAQAHLINERCCLIGVGGSNTTPFNTPVEFSEEEIAGFLKTAHSQAKEIIGLKNNPRTPLIMVAHPPPLETELDKLPNGFHVGSSAVREFIEKVQPALCLTGHIHEAKGVDHIGKTTIVNPGMINDGGWIDVHIDGPAVKAMLQ